MDPQNPQNPNPRPSQEKTQWWIKALPRTRKSQITAALGLPAAVLILASGVYWWLTKDLPDLIYMSDYQPPIVTQLVSRSDSFTNSTPVDEEDMPLENDQIVGEFFKERRYIVSYEKIPQMVINAFVAAEDDRFFQHTGISFIAILRAAIANFRAGHVVQGGSTITQQVAKSLFLTPERSFIRKFREAVLSYRIEKNLTKEQILYLYLNQIYLGRGTYGVQAASKIYFKKDIADVTLPEAALLAGLPQAPSKYNPLTHPERAKDRQKYVLRRMYETRFIDQEQLDKALQEKLKIHFLVDQNKQFAPHLVEHVRRYLIRKYGEQAVYEGGLRVELPAKPDQLRTARESLRDGLREVSKRRGFRGPLARIETEEEALEFATQGREDLIKKRLPFKLLLPEGLNATGAEMLEEYEIKPEDPLVSKNTIYRALVTEVNDPGRFAVVNVGGTLFHLPMSRMKWARQPDDLEKKLKFPPPQRPSQVLTIGDVVHVSFANPDSKENKQLPKEREDWIAVLEQEPQVQGALFSIEAKTGFVLAMVGGYEFEKSEFNRAIQAQRQPGSAFKPIIFSMAVEQGYTPASIIVDAPIIYKDEEFGKWKPTNFKEKFYGDTTFRLALIKSRNIPTIKVVQDLKVQEVIQYSRRLGMTGHFNEDLSISLGSATTSLVELTGIYSLYPRQGKKVNPVFLTKVVDRNGLVLEENLSQEVGASVMSIPLRADLTQPEEEEEAEEGGDLVQLAKADAPPEEKLEDEEASAKRVAPPLPTYPLEDDPDQVMDPRVAYVMTHLLKEVVAYGTGARARSLGRVAAGKTGTTNDYKDAWFMGFTPQVVTGVWVGFDDQRGLGPGETGSRAALPIWLDYMKVAAKHYPETEFDVPPGIVFAHIDQKTGRIVDQSSASAREEAFIAGTEPKRRAISGTNTVDSGSEFFKEDFQ